MKYDSTKHRFAVVQLSCTVFGLGETREQAISNAAEWIEPDHGMQGDGTVEDVEKLLKNGRGFCGDFAIVSDPDEIRSYVEAI